MQSQASRIRWNSFFAFLSQLIRLLTNFLMFVGIARFYGPEAFGQFTTAHTLSTIFLLFADFGFDTLLATEIARHRDSAASLARQYFSLKIIFAVCATLAMMAFPLFKSFSPETGLLIRIFALYVLFSSLNNFFFALFKGFEQFQHETKISFWINLTLLALLVICGILKVPIGVIAICFIVTKVLGFAVGFGISVHLFQVQLAKPDFSRWGDVFKRVSIFGLHAIFGNLYFSLDTILLAFWKGDREVGIYQAVFKLVTLVLLLPDIAVSTLVPVLSRLHVEDRERWWKTGRLLNKTLFTLGLPIGLVMFVFSEQIISIVYGGGAFTQSIPLLRIFAIIVIVRISVETIALMFTTSRRQHWRMWIAIAGTCINVCFNFYAIPRYGAYGAALVALLTNVVVGLSYILLGWETFVGWMIDVRNVIPLFLTVLLAVIIWHMRLISLWYILPFVMIVYGLAFYFVIYSKDEWALIVARNKYVSAS